MESALTGQRSCENVLDSSHEQRDDMSGAKWLLNLIRTFGFVLALLVGMNADASLFNRTESWTEKTLLHDGKSIEVKREVEFVMTRFKSWPTTYWIKFKHPNTGKTIKWQGEPHFEPVLLDFVNGVPYLVVYGQPDQSNMDKYGCPDIPYIFLRYAEENQDWILLQREHFPNELKDANLAPSYDGTYMPQNDHHPSLGIVEHMIESAERHSDGFFQSRIPLDFDSWHYPGKLRYKNERKRNDCRPARQPPSEIVLPSVQKIDLEILETKEYTPEWIINHDDWSRFAFKNNTECMRLLRPADLNDPLMNGRYLFVKDTTGRNVMQFKPFAAPGLNTICDGNNMWFTDYLGEGGMLILAKYSNNGTPLYRIGFERPEFLRGFMGGIMYPTFKSVDGYLYFDWWDSNDTAGERHVKRSLKVRLREPEPVITNNTIGLNSSQHTSPNANEAEAGGIPHKQAVNVKSFKDCPTCPEMIPIPGKSYALGKYEVTEGEWFEVMGYFSNISQGDLVNQPDLVNLPIVEGTRRISEFLERLNRKTGKNYRLPTETEWEYACYGGSQTKYCGGDDFNTVGWFRGSSTQLKFPGGRVGQKLMNGYGLYDMSGNVWELIDGCWKGDCSVRLVRGGSFVDYPMDVQEAYRYGASLPGVVGFRLARSFQYLPRTDISDGITAPTLHGIGVYEGSYPSGVRSSFNYHPEGRVDVEVHSKARPVILALSSYEPVVWNIKHDEGVIIKEIILSGYYASKVVGVDSTVRITRQGFGYAYQWDEKKLELAKKLKEYTGLDVETFQVMYTGKEFSVH